MMREATEYSPLEKPDLPGKLSFGQWTQKHLLALFLGNKESLEQLVKMPTLGSDSNASPDTAQNLSFFSPIFLMTYGIDGYEITNHQITPAHRHTDGELQQVFDYKGETLPTSLMLASFFGLPTRTGCNDEAVSNPASPSYTRLNEEESIPPLKTRKLPQLTGWGLLKNLIGGWDTLPDEPKYHEKKIWQWAALIPVKLCIILPFKLLTLPFKLLINIVKIFTELLPTLATHGLHLAIAKVLSKARKIVLSKAEWKTGKKYALLALVLVLSLLHVTFKLITLIGRTILSPDTSAKLAYAYGSEVNQALAITVFYLNKTITAIFWAIAMPLALGALILYFPTVIIPFMTWVAHVPWVAATLTSMNGALVSIATYFAMDFAPAIAALAALLQIEVTGAILVIGATLGFFGSTLIAITVSKVGDILSDRWALWHEGGPFTWLSGKLSGLLTSLSNITTPSDTELGSLKRDLLLKDPTQDSPTRKATTLGNIYAEGLEAASKSLETANANGTLAQIPPQAPNNTGTAILAPPTFAVVDDAASNDFDI